MANPIKAVKAIGRAVGGITGKGAKSVNPVYKNSNLKIPSNAHPKLHSKVSSSVKLVPSAEMKKTNSLFGPTSGAKQAGKENAQSINTSKRGLKAANKPTNKVGSKADKELRASTKSVSASKEQTKAQYDYYYGKGAGDDVTQIAKSVTPKNEARSVRTLKPKPRKPIKR